MPDEPWTPGRWTIRSVPQQNSGDEGDRQWWYAFTSPSDGRTFAEHEANARLMSASKQLLHALQMIMTRVEEGRSINSECRVAARTALKKATRHD